MLYLKCEYKNGGGALAVFSDEYLVTFRGIEKTYWSIVPKKDVIQQNEKTGLVKLVFVDTKKDGTSLVILNGVPDCRASIYHVQNENIVKKS